MKLSEAIRLGSLLKPQAFGGMWVGEGSCAFGAALDAIGINALTMATGIWPWLRAPMKCPVCGQPEVIVTLVISFHLNDKHLWTREEIADWVATVEPQEIEAAYSVQPKCAASGVPE